MGKLVFAGVLEGGSHPMRCREGRCKPQLPMRFQVSAVAESEVDHLGLAAGLPRSYLARGHCSVEIPRIRCMARTPEGIEWKCGCNQIIWDAMAVDRASFSISVSACRYCWLHRRFPVIQPVQLEDLLGRQIQSQHLRSVSQSISFKPVAHKTRIAVWIARLCDDSETFSRGRQPIKPT